MRRGGNARIADLAHASLNVSYGSGPDRNPRQFHRRLDEFGRRRYVQLVNDIGVRGVTPYRVSVEWDEDARVWIASSDDVPGLATGADTFEDLIEKLKIVIPELLVENGLLPAGTNEVPFAIRAERSELAPVA
jgi:predicted RNase H-like HicB family nuclease